MESILWFLGYLLSVEVSLDFSVIGSSSPSLTSDVRCGGRSRGGSDVWNRSQRRERRGLPSSFPSFPSGASPRPPWASAASFYLRLSTWLAHAWRLAAVPILVVGRPCTPVL